MIALVQVVCTALAVAGLAAISAVLRGARQDRVAAVGSGGAVAYFVAMGV